MRHQLPVDVFVGGTSSGYEKLFWGVLHGTKIRNAACNVLATHSLRLFPLYFSTRAFLCAVTFQLHLDIMTTGTDLQFFGANCDCFL